MKTLVVLESFDLQSKVVSALTSAGVLSSEIIPCSYNDVGLFAKDLSIQLILVEVSRSDSSKTLEIVDLIRPLNSAAKFVPLLHDKDTDLILQLIKRSIDDILIFPLDTEELTGIIRKFSTNADGVQFLPGGLVSNSGHRGKIVAVTSYKGGAGVSTVTANLGFCLAELDSMRKKTLILDLANQSNHCSLLLNAESVLHINEICRDIGRIESAYIVSTCTWITMNLAVIGTNPEMEGVQPPEFELMQAAMKLLAESFDYMVVDVPTHTFDGRFLATIEMADIILVVSSLEIASIRDTRLYLRMLRDLGIDQNKIRLLINRYDSESGMFKMKDLEQALQNPIAFYLPNDFQVMTHAAQAGQPVLEYKPESMIAEAFADLTLGIDSGSMFVPPKQMTDSKRKSSGIRNLFAGLK
ncbi:MAG: AAA family ATPase [Candidatus Caenarcaniphilales bacterium]|nr:AAA family ATPase [Candidatus Caenarcaniphilales bacterium]